MLYRGVFHFNFIRKFPISTSYNVLTLNKINEFSAKFYSLKATLKIKCKGFSPFTNDLLVSERLL
jgi:hypothetical protein